MFIVIVDTHSKWLKIHEVSDATSQGTIEKIASSFATNGLLELLVTDSGSVFTSEVVEEFLWKHGIQHVTLSPCYQRLSFTWIWGLMFVATRKGRNVGMMHTPWARPIVAEE